MCVVLLFGLFPNFSLMTSRAAIVEDSITDSALVAQLKDYYKEVTGVTLTESITDDTFDDPLFTEINLSAIDINYCLLFLFIIIRQELRLTQSLYLLM